MEPVVTPRTFLGRYEVTHLIARGGMAQVYRALDTRLGRHVALKVLFPELSVDRTFVERFRREAQAAANLSHPNVVAVYDWGEDEGTYFIVMELVTGTSLATALRSEGAMPATRSATIAAQVAAALAYAHRHGVVHRDIKPGNVLLTDEGLVKVTDFGIAQAISTEEGLTMAGSVMGTAAYFSPEQAEGAVVDGRSDVYSLGVVLYEMLAGRAPFVGDSPVAVASMHVRNEPPALRELNPAVPEAIEAVTMRAMQKSPAHRYQTADDFRADLLRFCEGRPVLAGTEAVGAGVAATSVLGQVGSTTVLPVAGGATSVLPTSGPTTDQVPAKDTTLAVPAVPGAAQALAPSAVPAAAVAAADGAPPEQRQRRRSSKEAWWIALALLVALLVVAFFVAHALAGPTTIRMPNLVNRQFQVARSILQGDGFVVKGKPIHSGQPAGIVLLTDPKAGTVMRAGADVLLTYSLGPLQNETVPPVTGQNVNAAISALQAVNLVARTQQAQQWTQPVIPDTVLAQSVPAGTVLHSGQPVVLTVLAPSGTYPVPNVTDETGAAAGSDLQKYGLNPGTQTSQCSSSVANGYVVSTSPAPGAYVQQGTPINLVISTGACPVQVPNLTGYDESEATQAAQAVQLSVTFQQQACSAGESPSGYVVSQTPLPLTSVQPGTPITATLGCSSTTTTTTFATGHPHGGPPGPHRARPRDG